MDDLPWIVFSKTGNIETYLLMKGYDYEVSNEISYENRLSEETSIDDQFDPED